MRRRIFTTWVVGAIVAAGLVTTGGAPDPVVEPQIEQVADNPKLRVIQHNVDGRPERFNAAMAETSRVKAHAVILQEVCETWMNNIPVVWTKHWATTQRGASACPKNKDGARRKGAAVIWTSPAASVDKPKYSLEPEPGDPDRVPRLVCLDVHSGTAHSICSTHLVAFDETDGALRFKQAEGVGQVLSTKLPGRRVILGGDFNTTPGRDAMRNLYAAPPNGSSSLGGKFTEGYQLRYTARPEGTSQGGPDTADGRKIDYIFFSTNFVPNDHQGSMEQTALAPYTGADGTKKNGHQRLLARVHLSPDDPSVPDPSVAFVSPVPEGDGTTTPPPPAPACDNDCYRAQMGVLDYYYNENSNSTDPRLKRFIFDRKFYAQTYSDVLPWAEGKVQTQGGKLYDHVEWHWLNRGIGWGRAGSATFDSRFYLSNYPDVAAVHGPEGFHGAIDHFVTFGQNESRRGSLFFDVNYYRSRYADMAGPLPRDLLQHFTLYGMNEGRQGSADFAPAWYLGTNPDLRNAFGRNYRKGMSHWISNGQAEGRRGTP